MVIILPEKFKGYIFLPSRFNYFSLNPEINLKKDFLNISIHKVFEMEDIKQLLKKQEELFFQKLPDKILPNSFKYHSNFKFIELLYIKRIKKILNKKLKANICYISEFKSHKSIRLYFIYLISKMNIRVNPKILFLLPFSLFKLLKVFFCKNIILFITNKTQYQNLKFNLKISSLSFLNSNNVTISNTISLESILLLYQVITLPFHVMELILIKINYAREININNISTSLLSSFLYKYRFAKIFRKICNFNLYTISNYGLSEALLLNNTSETDTIVNHGVHYYDSNHIVNEFWKFHAQTMFCSDSSIMISDNILDKLFILKNKINLKYEFKSNTLREKRFKIYHQNKKKILIADSFKFQDSLRPILYNNVFEYLYFIKQICEAAPKEYEIVLRHRPNTIISRNFVCMQNKRLNNSSNKNIYDDFLSDPIVISFSSTVLFEASQLGLRSISFDPLNRDIEFLNFSIYNPKSNLPKRFLINVRGKENLKNLLCKI